MFRRTHVCKAFPVPFGPVQGLGASRLPLEVSGGQQALGKDPVQQCGLARCSGFLSHVFYDPRRTLSLVFKEGKNSMSGKTGLRVSVLHCNVQRRPRLGSLYSFS